MTTVFAVTPDTSASEVADLMASRSVGAVVMQAGDFPGMDELLPLLKRRLDPPSHLLILFSLPAFRMPPEPRLAFAPTAPIGRTGARTLLERYGGRTLAIQGCAHA